MRKYQKEALKRLKKKTGKVDLPPGSGKTIPPPPEDYIDDDEFDSERHPHDMEDGW